MNILKQTPLATAVKRATMCAATAALLTTTSMALADHEAEGGGSDLEVKISGYVKVDAIYDLDQDLGPSFFAGGIDTDPNASSNPSFQMHAKQSRLNVTASKEHVKVVIEGDFFTPEGNQLISNSSGFRLRHAYGQVGNFLAGQTWSTFMDKNWVLYPTTVDFGGPAAATFIRQAQFRWSVTPSLDLAIENPENRIEGEDHRDTLPDFVARYARTGTVSWQVAGMAQQFEVDGGANDGLNESNFAYTGGINIAFGKGSSVSAKVNVNANRYTYYGWMNPAAVVNNGSLETIDHVGGLVAYNIGWGGKSNAKSTIALGSVQFDDEFLAPGDVDNISTLHVNYRWNPWNNVEFGAEVMFGDQELVNGNTGDATRLQFATKFNF
ncbi:MAG: hypothetical protein DRQ59_05020 [Gammaproteobacteria bacterium]|nr:MAG: hypothetical protein DRQ59_05020 [Gammaproteobacteria bacterium]